MSSPIEFKIDGKTVAAQPGETILTVARANGIEIPSLCFDERVSKNTSCFVCVVKDAKTGRFLPSCAACPAPGQEIESDTDEVRSMRRTALELLLSEHSGDCEAPCTVACPAHAAVEEYVRAGRNGEFLECLKIVKERIPLPMSIGRVCPRFCEKDCRRNLAGGAVAINDFKRLAADLYYDEYMEELAPETGKKVGIVGAGPAGLSAAYFLRRLGVAVTLFDAMPEAGGMIRYGIPEYRLPKRGVLDRELAHFAKMGVKFEFNRKLGENLTAAELENAFDAVGLAVGCWNSGSLRCEGEELASQGIDFLRDVALGGNTAPNPGRVIVVGGGNTAMDCVRTSVRLGASSVQCFYRRTENEMPAEKIEIHEAREEGVSFEFLVAPVKLARNSDGSLTLTCQRMTLGEADASGRRRPVPVEGSEFDVVADTVIAAVGQSTAAPEGFAVNRRGDLDANRETLKLDGKFFAAGDCVSGAATVVEAVASGRRMALGMYNMLTNSNLGCEKAINVSRGMWQSMKLEDVVVLRDMIARDRAPQPVMDAEERKHTFDEVAATYAPEVIQSEGERCFECSCTCKSDCKLKKASESCQASPTAIKGGKNPVSYDNSHSSIIQDRGKCIKCGICVKTCKEIINKSLLSPKNRGFFTYVGTARDAGFPASCAECGACINACPTGALGWKNKQ